MNGITINKQNGGLGRIAPTEDGICALIGTGFASLGNTNEAYRLLSYEDLLAISTPTQASAIFHRNVKDFFRLSPAGKLWVIDVDTVNKTFTDDVYKTIITSLVNAAGGKVRVLGVVPTTAVTLSSEVPAAQLFADESRNNHAPLHIVLALFGDAPSPLEDLRALNSSSVSVFAGSGNLLSDDSGVTALSADVGTLLGVLSNNQVFMNAGWVGKNNVQVGATTPYDDGDATTQPWEEYMNSGIMIPYIGTKKVSDISQTDQEDLHAKGYIFFKTYSDFPGIYFNDSHTCVKITDDYAYIENNRTVNKATRLIRKAFLPYVNSPIYIDPDTGKIAPNVIADLEGVGSKAITDNMFTQQEVSGFDFTIDPNQDILATSKLEASLKITPVGTAREIVINIGFNNPFNS